MKKLIIFIATLLIFFSSTVFAECNLNPMRWKWVGSTDKVGYFYDSKTLSYNTQDHTATLWIVFYYRRMEDIPEFAELGLKGEMYSYSYETINYKDNTYIIKESMLRNADGQVINSFKMPSYDLQPLSIPPDSIIEHIAFIIKPSDWR